MCVGDYKLGRLIRSIITNVNIVAGNTRTFLADHDRVAFFVGVPQTSLVSVQFESDALGINATQVLTTGNPLLLSLLTHGDLPTREIVLAATVGNVEVVVIEWTLPEEVVAGEPPAGAKP